MERIFVRRAIMPSSCPTAVLTTICECTDETSSLFAVMRASITLRAVTFRSSGERGTDGCLDTSRSPVSRLAVWPALLQQLPHQGKTSGWFSPVLPSIDPSCCDRAGTPSSLKSQGQQPLRERLCIVCQYPQCPVSNLSPTRVSGVLERSS